MADYYCDVSAVGNEYQAYNDTPATWGVPQDGNGKAGPGHSAAVAIATVDCASAVGDGSQSLTILGVTVTNASSASGATLAASLVTSINSTATAVSSTYSALLLPLNRLVFARQNPDNTAQVQIMLRIAGADWNGVVTSHTGFGTGPTITNFAGGMDGPFAYVLRTDTVFGKTMTNYGTWFASVSGVADPGSSDLIHYRTRRAGSDLGYVFSTTSAIQPTWKTRNHLFDDGTVWAGDNGKLTVEIICANAGGFQNIDFMTPNTAGAGPSLGSRSKYNLEILVSALFSSSRFELFATNSANQNASFTSSRFVVKSTSLAKTTLNAAAEFTIPNRHTLNFTDSQFESTGVPCRIANYSQNSGFNCRLILNGVDVLVNSATGGVGGIEAPVRFSGTHTGLVVEWVGGSVIDSLGIATCLMPITVNTASSETQLTVDRVKGITDAYVGFPAGYDLHNSMIWTAADGTYRYETAQFLADWKNNGSFPYYNAPQPQGDYWSHRITWNTAPNVRVPVIPLNLSFFYREAAATKTVALELYVPDSTPLYTDNLRLTINYTDSSGVQRVETESPSELVQFSATRTPLVASAAVWTSAGLVNHAAKKVEMTTNYAIKQNSEISVSLSLAGSRGLALVFYVSPEVTLT